MSRIPRGIVLAALSFILVCGILPLAAQQLPPAPDLLVAPPDLAEDNTEPSTDVEQWTLRCEQVKEGMLAGELGTEDANALYRELRGVLAGRQRELRAALAIAERGGNLQETLDLHETWNALYEIRLSLLETISPELRARVLGTGITGVQELGEELERIGLEWSYQRTLTYEQAREWWGQVQRAPLPMVWNVVQWGLLILLLYLWLNWSRGGLTALRMRVLEIRPRTQVKLRTARFIWYVEQIRHPIGWLLFMEAFFAIPGPSPFDGPLERVSALLRWALLVLLAIRLLNAFAARDKTGLSGETARLRVRSLWLIASWALLLGLGLELVDAYTGHGTLHAWFRLGMQVLAVPALVLLVVWWRPTIYAEIEQLPKRSDWIHDVLSRRKGLRGFLGAALGGIYLLMREGALNVVERLAATHWGRGLRSHLYRVSLTRSTEQDGVESGLLPLPDELRARLQTAPEEWVERAGRTELRRLLDLAHDGTGGVVALIADRGFGKSTVLRRLNSEYDDKMLHIHCPPGGLGPLLHAFANQLDLPQEEATMESIAQRVAERGYQLVAVDGYHHVVRPIMGALDELDQLGKLAALAPDSILWVVTLNRAAWSYVSCARGARIALKDLLELPPWSEELIGRLIELRCQAAGIDPDFSRIRLSRVLVEGDYDNVADRNRDGLYRLIQDIAQGSPASAIRVWTHSLAVAPDGTVVVRLPELPESIGLETGNMQHLLVLRVILQCDLATEEEIVASLRLLPMEVGIALRFLTQRGWLEAVAGRYRITDRKYYEVIRALNRRNLISTSSEVGVL